MGAFDMSVLLRTRELAVGFTSRELMTGVDFTVRAGELAALIGLNGSGKSTLLRTLAGLHKPLGGEVLVNGRELRAMSVMERARAISVVLTGRPGTGLLNVRTLVSLGRQPWTGHLGRLASEDHARVQDAMVRTGVDVFADRSLGSLSDGEAQKVLIARALAQATPLMLLDEPTAFLDVVNRVAVLHLLKSLATDMGRAMVLSTHDLGSAMQLCDRLLLVHAGSVWSGTPEEALASGILDTAFSTAGLRFDPASASLRTAGKQEPLR